MLGLVERIFMWVARTLLVLAGIIAGLFVARDAAHFGIVKLFVLLGLIGAYIAAIATWPTVVAWFRKRK